MNKRLPSLSKDRLPAMIESILFVADEAVEISMLARVLRRPADAIEQALSDIRTEAFEVRLEDAVESGRITQDEADEMLENYESGSGFHKRGRGGFKGHGRGRGRGWYHRSGSQATPTPAPAIDGDAT